MYHKFFQLNKKNRQNYLCHNQKNLWRNGLVLPLIHQVKNQFQIYAILENKRELNILKRNNFLFERFKDYFDGYFIENKFKNFFKN